MMTQIALVGQEEIAPFMRAAKREGLVFNSGTTYYGYFANGELVAFAGMMYQKRKVVLQSDYVQPAFRRRGIYSELIQYRLALAKTRGYRRVEINCLPASENANLRLGAKFVKAFKICKKLVYDI